VVVYSVIARWVNSHDSSSKTAHQEEEEEMDRAMCRLSRTFFKRVH